MGKRSKYENLKKGMKKYSGIDQVKTIEQYHEAVRKLYEYIDGVKWNYIRPENRPKLWNVIYEYIDELTDEAKERIIDYWREYTPRYRPSYEKVLEHLLDHPEALELYEESPMKAYREIARETGYSWRTVRDAFWSFRRAGVL